MKLLKDPVRRNSAVSPGTEKQKIAAMGAPAYEPGDTRFSVGGGGGGGEKRRSGELYNSNIGLAEVADV